MYLVGLTGGIGSGKSTVARLLAERGATVIDADELAREVVEPGTPGHGAVVERFGPDVVAPDGGLDRERLSEIVFADDAARADLNAIVHPLVGERVVRALGELAQHDGVVVLDVPLLVEAASERGYRQVVVVVADEDVRVARLVADRGMDPEQVRARIAAQASDDERRAIADHVIDNNGDREGLERQVDAVWQHLREAAAA